MKKVSIAVTLLLLLVSTSAFAQVTASLSGTVSDSSGALIPGVEVTAKNTRTGITATNVTNETGAFVLLSLQPGTYTLEASLSGFQKAAYNNVELGQGQAVRLNFTLQVGGAAQNVEVTIAADTILATTSASVGNVLSDKDLLAAPLATRNVIDLVATSAGVVITPNIFGGTQVNFGGTGVGSVNTTRDGLVTNDGRYNPRMERIPRSSPVRTWLKKFASLRITSIRLWDAARLRSRCAHARERTSSTEQVSTRTTTRS